MLSKPESGWTEVKTGSFIDRASYLTNIPLDCLDAFIHAIKKHTQAVVGFDAEGWEYIIVSDHYETYIILNKDEHELLVADVGKVELAKELCTDIRSNIDDWAWWEFNEDEHGASKYKALLCQKVIELESLLQ